MNKKLILSLHFSLVILLILTFFLSQRNKNKVNNNNSQKSLVKEKIKEEKEKEIKEKKEEIDNKEENLINSQENKEIKNEEEKNEELNNKDENLNNFQETLTKEEVKEEKKKEELNNKNENLINSQENKEIDNKEENKNEEEVIDPDEYQFFASFQKKKLIFEIVALGTIFGIQKHYNFSKNDKTKKFLNEDFFKFINFGRKEVELNQEAFVVSFFAFNFLTIVFFFISYIIFFREFKSSFMRMWDKFYISIWWKRIIFLIYTFILAPWLIYLICRLIVKLTASDIRAIERLVNNILTLLS